jgi:hypothetical protein
MSAELITRERVQDIRPTGLNDERELWALMRPDYPGLPDDHAMQPVAALALGRLVRSYPQLLAVPAVALVTWCVLLFG